MSNISIIELQRQMFEAIHEGKPFTIEMHETDNFTANQRIKVYRDDYRIRFEETLAADFPRLKSYMQEIEWRNITDRYVKKYPSRTTNLNNFGKYFPQFVLDSFGGDTVEATLAEFEWCLCETLYKDDEPSIDYTEFANSLAENLEQITCEFSSNLTLKKSPWDLDAIVALPQDKIYVNPTNYLIYKTEFRSKYMEVTDDFIQFVNLLKTGNTLGYVFENMTGLDEETVKSIFSIFRETGIIKSFKLV